MPYYPSSSRSSSYRSAAAPSNNKSVWQQAGATMSVNNACAQYGVTEEQMMEAGLECKWRSHFGNSYAVVICSDVAELKRKLDKEAAEKKEQELKDKLGEEGYAKMKQEEKEKKEAEAKAAKDKADHEAALRDVTEKISILMKVSDYGITPIEGVKLAKTKAKAEWFLKDADLEQLQAEQVGKVKKYNLRDLIQKALKKYPNKSYESSDDLTVKLLKGASNNKERISYYAAFLKEQIDAKIAKLPKDVGDTALKQFSDMLQTNVGESLKAVQAAQKTLKAHQNKKRSFETMFELALDKENAGNDDKKMKAA